LEGLFSHVGVETHKWLDPECGHEGCQSLVLKARAEQAEAQLADAKAALTKYGDQGAFQALRDGAERAERAETERDAIAEWVIMIENRLECAVRGDEICKGCVDVAYSYAKEARAALTPPPAGQEG